MSNEIGLRFNKDKIRHDLLPPFAINEVAKVLTFGATKYEPRNWEKGLSWTSTLASLKRHLNLLEQREDYDKESNMLHAAHIATNALMLLEFYKIAPQFDDRPLRTLDQQFTLDIDDVICSWMDAWTDRFNLPKTNNSWYFDRNILDRFKELANNKELDEFYLSLKPLIDPKDLPFEPHSYVTSRPVDSEITEKWLDMHGFPTRPVITVGLNGSKVDAIKSTGCKIHVDDSYRNYLDLTKNGICCYLFDRPWNHKYDVGFKRIYSLNDLK